MSNDTAPIANQSSDNVPVLDPGMSRLKPMSLTEFKARNRRLEKIAEMDSSAAVIVSDSYWKPREGESFVGQFVGLEVRSLEDQNVPGQRNDIPHVIFDTVELGTISHAGCVLIDNIVKRVPVGAIVKVTYDGRPKKAMAFTVGIVQPDGTVLDESSTTE